VKCRLHSAKVLAEKNASTAVREVNACLINSMNATVNRGALCTAFGFAMWLIDFLACSYSFTVWGATIRIQDLFLHAYCWHILTAAALYQGGLVAFQYRCLLGNATNGRGKVN
jgi:hypothetical protein